jgi:hypothetical protein
VSCRETASSYTHYFLANKFTEVSLDSPYGSPGNGLIRLLILSICMKGVGDASPQIHWNRFYCSALIFGDGIPNSAVA